jgi:hypothetical protein
VSVFDGIPELCHEVFVFGIRHLLGVACHGAHGCLGRSMDNEVSPWSEPGRDVVWVWDHLEVGVQAFPGGDDLRLEGGHGGTIS